MQTLRGLLSTGFSFPDTLDLPQTTAIAGCRPWSATIPPFSPQSPSTQLRGVTAVSANDVWAVGFTSQPPDEDAPILTLIEHWDGKSWQVVPSPNPEPNAALFGLAVVSASDIWAVGVASNTFFSSNQFTATLVEHWDGQKWRVVASPSPGWGSNILLAVAAIAAHDVWAVGSYTSNLPETGQSQTLVEHWNGLAWQLVPSESPGLLANELFGIVRVPGTQTLWTVGLKADTVQVVQPLAEFSCERVVSEG
jgi:hypothetical protein